MSGGRKCGTDSGKRKSHLRVIHVNGGRGGDCSPGTSN